MWHPPFPSPHLKKGKRCNTSLADQHENRGDNFSGVRQGLRFFSNYICIFTNQIDLMNQGLSGIKSQILFLLNLFLFIFYPDLWW